MIKFLAYINSKIIYFIIATFFLYFDCSNKNKEDFCRFTISFDDEADHYKCDPEYGKKKRECILSHLHQIQTANECLRVTPENSQCKRSRESAYIYLNCCPARPCM